MNRYDCTITLTFNVVEMSPSDHEKLEKLAAFFRLATRPETTLAVLNTPDAIGRPPVDGCPES